ncbi:aspartate/glutamate racemase family protein [Clostridium estertheticum]|uniref:aspartate/glutamate racemase family protein n=1 Tax=Clostridium estertheticum TaxID=238834 RepID=UPI0024CA3660|nr:aspartate/glutamate racemase family protein [Clostridium estertheticum]
MYNPFLLSFLQSLLNSLKNEGADFVIIAANSPHSVFHQVNQHVDIPMISIIDTTVQKRLN